MIHFLEAIFGEVKVEHNASRPKDLRGTRVSITKAKGLLGWEPETKFEKSLGLYVKNLMKEMEHGS